MPIDAAARLAAQKDAAFAALTGAGLHPDRDLVSLIDVAAIKVDDAGRTTLPPGFAASVKAAKPHLFAGADTAPRRGTVNLGDFDARTASPAEVAARFAELEKAARARRFDALTAQALAKLEREDADRGARQANRIHTNTVAAGSASPAAFDARTASPADVERELAALTGSRTPYVSHGAR